MYLSYLLKLVVCFLLLMFATGSHRPINKTHCEEITYIEQNNKHPKNTNKPKIVCCEGYIWKKRDCIPECDEHCENSRCTEPNVCTCNEGYKRMNKYRCTPDCNNTQNCHCAAPNICECYDDFKKDENGICVLKDCPCLNGACIEPDKCACLNGYESSPDNKLKCEPICDENCENGNCIAPNKCQCLAGFQFKIDSNTECVPVCDPKCTNGQCTKGNECICDEGYVRVNRSCVDDGTWFINSNENSILNESLTSEEGDTNWILLGFVVIVTVLTLAILYTMSILICFSGNYYVKE